ncbi:hypothetical protein BIV23_31760 [Streptomyces monashensis]|uniref:Uncharacterized protein n=1 Tax=Streptomyces monashensis TaxID=1678012 RepID=A0A1S2PUK2_9ACTN|nr:hypothetical protein BIV23_31760 [Streptomyces monashensis]
MFAQMRSADAPATQLDALQQQLDQLGERVARAEPLGGAIEELRGRIVVLSDTAHTRGRAPDDRASVLDGLERQLAGMAPDTAALDPAGRQDCEDLLGRLRAATGPGAETHFEALLGSVEHALTRHAATAGRRAAEEGRRAEDDRRRTEEEQRRAVERETARAAAEEAERDRVEAVLTEAADRLGVVQESAEDAVAEARELGDPNLAERIGQALRAGTAALGAKEPDAALKAVGDLEELLTEAESELDELHIAHTRRSDLALALQDAMIGEGFAFTGGDEDGDAIVLRFQRPSGATYETTVATEDDGSPLLVYHVDGEPDVVLHPPAEGAVCDQTEDLLERVHEAIGEQDGFVPGELTWQGKPPSRQAKQLPGAEEWRWTR